MDTMLIYSEIKYFCWHKDKAMIFSMIVAFQRRGVEGSKKERRREVLPNAYFVGKQVVVRNCTIVLILCVLWGFRRGITERLPKGR